MKKAIPAIVFIISLLGCGRANDNGATEIINLVNVSSVPFLDIFETGILGEPTYIPLNNSEPMGEIRQIKKHGDKFYFVHDKDRYSAELKVYNINGMPVSKVGAIGRGPGEYLTVNAFDIDKSGNIYVADARANKLIIYDANYKYVDTRSLLYDIESIKCLDDGNYLLALPSWNSEEYDNAMVVIADKEMNIVKTLLKYDMTIMDSNYILSRSGLEEAFDKIFFHPSSYDSVFVMNSKGEYEKKYQFDLGPFKLPVEYRTNIDPHFEELSQYRYLAGFTIANDKYVLGNLRDKDVIKYYIMMRENGIMYELTSEIFGKNTIGAFTTIIDNNLVSVITVTDETMDLLPEDIQERGLNSDYILCIYPLR
jgi:hypothetical protein